MRCLWITLLYLIPNIIAIQTNIKRPVRFVDPSNSNSFQPTEALIHKEFDWEQGLREATIQTFFREHVAFHDLRKHIHDAPIYGKQNSATPFGDVAVLARGQLYARDGGFLYVQDRYQNDCEGCHNFEEGPNRHRCIFHHCQKWQQRPNEHLIALWSIKRIRHRPSTDRFKTTEVEFRISPLNLRYSEEIYVTKDGTFNYNIPGHVFVQKSIEHARNLDIIQKPPAHKTYRVYEGKQLEKPSSNVDHSYPGTSNPPQYLPPIESSHPSPTTELDPEEVRKLYQTLLQVLHKKTSVVPTRLPMSAEPTGVFSKDPTTLYYTKPTTRTTQFQTTKLRPTEGFQPSSPATVQMFSSPSTTLKQQDISFDDIFSTSPETSYIRPPPTSNLPYTTTKQVDITTHYSNPSTTTRPVQMTFHFFTAEDDEDLKTTSNPKNTITTTIQHQYTTQNELYHTALPTRPTVVYYEALPTSKSTASSIGMGTVQRVTSPLLETTYSTIHYPTKPVRTTTVVVSTNGASTDIFNSPITDKELETISAEDQQQTEETFTTSRDNQGIYSTLDDTVPIPTTSKTGTPFNVYTRRPFQTTLTPTYINVPITETESIPQTSATQIYHNENIDESVTSLRPPITTTQTRPTPRSTPKRILTTISNDGTVSVKTTPYELEQLFGATRSSLLTHKPTKSYKASSTEKSNFLTEDEKYHGFIPLFKKPLKDYNEDDIFGATKVSKLMKTRRPTVFEKYTKSDLEQDLFDRNSKGKIVNIRRTSATEPTPTKVVYAEYFETTTPVTTTKVTTTQSPSTTVRKRPKFSLAKTTTTTTTAKPDEPQGFPVTSQSLMTSISYKVNRKKMKPKEISRVDTFEAKKENISETTTSLTSSYDNQSDIIQRLAVQVKGIEYLDKEVTTTSPSTSENTSEKTTKKPKYMKRKTYIPSTNQVKSRRGNRRSGERTRQSSRGNIEKV